MGMDKRSRAIHRERKVTEKRVARHRSTQSFEKLVREGQYDIIEKHEKKSPNKGTFLLDFLQLFHFPMSIVSV
jgi:indole-3-glycerol phosphate synthase